MSNLEATERLKRLAMLMRSAFGKARVSEPGAEVIIAVAARNEDGSGRLVATFNGPAFLQDLENLLSVEVG